MKILLVTYSLKGGAGKACYRLYEALKQINLDVKILYLDGFVEINNDIRPYFKTKSKYLVNQLSTQLYNKVASILFKKESIIYKKTFLHAWLKHHELFIWADVINLHWIGNSLNWKVFFNRIRKPIVWTLHDMLPFSGGYHYESEASFVNEKYYSRVEEKKARYITKANLTLVAPSTWILDISKTHLTFRGLEHFHILNCISGRAFKPIEKTFARNILDLPLDKKIVLFSADSVDIKRKGFAYLIDALNGVDDHSIFLLSMGKGLPKDKLKIPYKDLGMLHDEYSLSLAYSSADLVAVPSLEDNSPNIILESFACGVPVVGFKTGGIPELINDNNLGIVVDPIGSKELENGIQIALKRSYDTNYIHGNFTERFSYENARRNYLELFNKLLRNEG